MQQMLQFHPDDRISVEGALRHPYLKDFHGQMSEPFSKSLFDFSFEQHEDNSEMTESEV
jgi:mitogen-activated protein kinase 7